MYSNKNKGMFLETVINESLLRFNHNYNAFFIKRNIDISIIKNNKQHIIGKLKEKSQADYYGFYVGCYFDFEAKQTNLNKFYLKQLKDHQLNHLILIHKNKGYAFLIIHFCLYNRFFCITIKQIIDLLFKNIKSITLNWSVENAIEINLVFPGIFDWHQLLVKIINKEDFK